MQNCRRPNMGVGGDSDYSLYKMQTHDLARFVINLLLRVVLHDYAVESTSNSNMQLSEHQSLQVQLVNSSYSQMHNTKNSKASKFKGGTVIRLKLQILFLKKSSRY